MLICAKKNTLPAVLARKNHSVNGGGEEQAARGSGGKERRAGAGTAKGGSYRTFRFFTLGRHKAPQRGEVPGQIAAPDRFREDVMESSLPTFRLCRPAAYARKDTAKAFPVEIGKKMRVS